MWGTLGDAQLPDRDAQYQGQWMEDILYVLRSIGLWRWYINVTITILDIIHYPVFYLKLNSIL
jgi:hypothetical protein